MLRFGFLARNICRSFDGRGRSARGAVFQAVYGPLAYAQSPYTTLSERYEHR